ncbi:ASCH domain-containing protein [Leuconostoc rapi]|uniref:ASCH domain-containing protein n=1 Tax=Leuconostoc rapi TaxID=1406906 RepID=UPI001959F50C|nr:ASCH domain-containing protein [Leuconostoc rapi]MBM7435695.1 putative transcriptional regulator [Leuconostoc rapi]
MKALLSIKPEYVRQILAGTKKYEYRRIIFARQDVSSIVIYSTLPDGLVVAEVEVRNILKGSKSKIWNETKGFSGISRAELFDYFDNKDEVYAIELGKVTPYLEPKSLKEFNPSIKAAPQSFIYI